MIYQTIALNYVRIVNPDVYEHASQFDAPPPNWSRGTIRADETRAGNWTTSYGHPLGMVRDGKLTIPLENWLETLERRRARI